MNLGDPRLYLVAPSELRAGKLSELVPELVAAGVDIVQLREKGRSPDEVARLSQPVLEACREAGIPFIVNDYPDVAAAIGADGVHVGREDVPVPQARDAIGDGIVGTSTHSRDDIDQALSEAPDYIAVGPLHETPTKPGRAATGYELLAYAQEKTSVPWFAIGGIDLTNLDEVMAAGATRIVVVRAITEARDPVAATDALRGKLDPARI